jgi:hypothetical protein
MGSERQRKQRRKREEPLKRSYHPVSLLPSTLVSPQTGNRTEIDGEEGLQHNIRGNVGMNRLAFKCYGTHTHIHTSVTLSAGLSPQRSLRYHSTQFVPMFPLVKKMGFCPPSPPHPHQSRNPADVNQKKKKNQLGTFFLGAHYWFLRVEYHCEGFFCLNAHWRASNIHQTYITH